MTCTRWVKFRSAPQQAAPINLNLASHPPHVTTPTSYPHVTPLTSHTQVDDSGGSKDKPAGFEPPPTFAEAYIELLERFKSKVVQRLDVGTAEARVEVERAAIMEQLAKTGTAAEVRGGKGLDGHIPHGRHITWRRKLRKSKSLEQPHALISSS